MFDPLTLDANPPAFDLTAATRKAVSDYVAAALQPGEHYAIVSSVDLTGKLHLGGAVRVGDHIEIQGDLAGHLGSKDFSGQVAVVVKG